MTVKRTPEETRELIQRLLSAERAQELDTFAIMTFFPLEPDQHVADIGAGPGFFSIPLAKHLIYGKLYALDSDEEMLKVLRQRVAEARLGNVEIIHNENANFPLPPGSMDAAFLAFVIHDQEDKEGFLRAVKALLKDRGWAGVVEHYPREGENVPRSRRVSPDDLKELAAKVGLRFIWWRDINGKDYMALLRK